RHLAEVPRRLSSWPPRACVSLRDPDARRAAADPPRPDQTPLVSRAQLNRGVARMPPRLRFLLQGGVLRRRSLLLHTNTRPGAGRNRSASWSSSLLSRRSSVRRATFRGSAVRRHAWHGTAVAGGGYGHIGAGAE